VAAPIFQFNRHREDIQQEVVGRTVPTLSTFGGMSPPRSLQLVLNDAAFHEIHRLERSGGEEAQQHLGAWQRLARRIGRMSEAELMAEVERLSWFYVRDIVGNFNPRVYRMASSVLPVGLSMLFNTTDVAHGVRSMRDLSRRIRVEGELDTIRRLAKQGTLVVVPTHSSNLDSIVLGWSLVEAELPPCSYGAGKNLFTNPLLSYFMHNLGAYRVDRRLRHGLYKEVLKTYSQVLVERGYHTLFFPGGTRSRSGEVEQHLKLGLLGSTLAAYAHRIHRGDKRPVYVVPVTINYPLTLEAETLIDDHLAATGQARYIIEDDEFSRVARIAHFAVKVMALETTMVIRYGAPLDVFGNRVGDDGKSRGPDGTLVDPESYLTVDGQPAKDPARDAEYTRELGRRIGQAFLREMVVLPTHFAGWLMFERERRMAPELDLFALLRTTSGDRHALAVLYADAERVRARLVKLERQGRLRLDPGLRSGDIQEVLDEAVRTFGMYHSRSAIERLEDSVVVRDPKLLFYYGNRLRAFDDALREDDA
jgi:glycerol-3-phosphate O-acyltransferase